MNMQYVMIIGLIMALLFLVAIQVYKHNKTLQEIAETKEKERHFEADRVDTIECLLLNMPAAGIAEAVRLAVKQYEHAYAVGKLLKQEHEKQSPNYHLDALKSYINLNFDAQLQRVVEKSYKDEA